jgi:hypothetical protein
VLKKGLITLPSDRLYPEGIIQAVLIATVLTVKKRIMKPTARATLTTSEQEYKTLVWVDG